MATLSLWKVRLQPNVTREPGCSAAVRSKLQEGCEYRQHLYSLTAAVSFSTGLVVFPSFCRELLLMAGQSPLCPSGEAFLRGLPAPEWHGDWWVSWSLLVSDIRLKWAVIRVVLNPPILGTGPLEVCALVGRRSGGCLKLPELRHTKSAFSFAQLSSESALLRKGFACCSVRIEALGVRTQIAT